MSNNQVRRTIWKEKKKKKGKLFLLAEVISICCIIFSTFIYTFFQDHLMSFLQENLYLHKRNRKSFNLSVAAGQNKWPNWSLLTLRSMFNNPMVLLLDTLKNWTLGRKHCTSEYYMSKKKQTQMVIQNGWPSTEILKEEHALNT